MATIREVAAAAGVAPSTVSYVLSGKKRLPSDTIEKVRESILKLGYRPNATARALALGRTDVIGLLAAVSPEQSETDADVFMRFVRAAMFTARRHSYDVLVMGRGDDELFGEPLIDALVVMDVRMHDPRLPLIAALQRPTVLIGNPADAMALPAIDLDFTATGSLAAQHLFELGHRDIRVVSPTAAPGAELSWVARFTSGILETAGQLGMTVHIDGTASAAVEKAASACVILDLARLDEVLSEAQSEAVSIPRDLSVIVLAPEEQLLRTHPTLTVLDLPGRDMITRAVETVLAAVDGSDAPALQLLPPRLIERGSTATLRD